METRQPDTITNVADALMLELEDDEFISVINKRIEQSQAFYKSEETSVKGLTFEERVEINRDYFLGNQTGLDQLYDYQSHLVDNVIWEGENTIKPIALSRLPDIIVKPGSDSEESKQSAKDLTDIVNSDIRKRDNRKLLGLAHLHLPIFFRGIIKAYWDSRKGEYGDYAFKIVHPDNFVVDHTVPTNDTNQMSFVAEACEYSVKEVMMMFPKKAEELKSLVHATKYASEGTMDENRLASKIKIWEVWFDWYKQVTNDETGEKEWEKISATVWKYDTLILGKMKNPYWDWQGKKRLFTLEYGKKKILTDQEISEMMFGGQDQNVMSEQVYYNYLPDPSKPYFIMGYNTLGEHPYDCTSRIEQVIPQQDDINRRGRQITDMNDKAQGKHVFSTDSGLTKDMIENMDFRNPEEDIIVNGKLGDVHAFIPGTPAPAQLYQDQELSRNKALNKMGVHSTTRGERESQETATGRQILREADYGRIDDLVEETINPAAEWEAMWAMQFIKLFYTKDHMRKLLGKDGEVTFSRINRDTVENGMEVVVSASGVDKVQKKREAFEMAKLKLIDPLTFFEDIEASDPIGRTEKLMMFMNPQTAQLYFQKFVNKLETTGDMTQALAQMPTPGMPAPQVQPQLTPQPQM